jgi:hypothetical protein
MIREEYEILCFRNLAVKSRVLINNLRANNLHDLADKTEWLSGEYYSYFLELCAGFNPSQPRVPRGTQTEGSGQQIIREYLKGRSGEGQKLLRSIRKNMVEI